ncbi:hypothetical protein LIER_05854 [Lithospermum erythrorhizon]|uniref:Serine protease n=1 Tax=Lithospermum erythrorhizon TaxID=34254 RepID=A0AAV3P6S9_LITER
MYIRCLDIVSCSTGFCVDPTGILLCTHHGVTQKVGDKYIESDSVDAIQDGKKVNCEIILLWKQFDTAVLRLKAKDLDRFDYVSFVDDHFSRNLPSGMELFSIGCCASKSLQFLRGTLTYTFEKDETDYTSLVDNEEYIFDVKNSGLYKNSSCRTVAELMPYNEYLHPHLNLIEFQYTGLTDSGGQ